MVAVETTMLRAVEIICDAAGWALLCLIGTKQVRVPLTVTRHSREPYPIGSRGRHSVPRWLAQEIGVRH